MNLPKGAIRTFDRLVLSRAFGLRYRPGRALVEALAILDPPRSDVEVRKGSAGGRSARLVVPEGARETPRVLWIHGGAFCFNSPRAYTSFAAQLASALGESVLMPSYRRAPEHPFPAALDDVIRAYRAVAAQGTPLILAGDSAGGGLALSAAIRLRDDGDPPPAGLLLMSPWVDLTLSGSSVQRNDGADATLRAEYLPPLAAAYAGGVDLADPRISPLNADLSGLPPALIQCGGDELFLSEGEELASRLQAAGSPLEMQVFDGLWHDFQVHAAMLPEAAGALRRMADWAQPLLV